MLQFLSIQNIVLIEKADIDFDKSTPNGLYIFTGETGSGKSLLLNAIGLVAGKRISSRFISDSSQKATVYAQFDIENNPVCKELLLQNDLLNDENSNIVTIRKIIHKSSSNKIYINDQVVGTTIHSKIGQSLVEIHGQSETSNLLNESNHINILDQYANNESLLLELKNTYNQIKKNKQKLKEFEEKKEEYIREKDYLSYVIQELDDADVGVGEQKDLTSKRDSLKNKDLLVSFFSNLKKFLSITNENLYNAQNEIIRNQHLLNENDQEEESKYIAKLSEELDESSVKIDSDISDINNMARNLQIDNFDIGEIESRLFEIKNLSRKYNIGADELIEVREKSQVKLETLENEDKFIIQLQEVLVDLINKYDETCNTLNKRRNKSAKNLSSQVEGELKFLKMESVKFQINVDHDEKQTNENGKDKVRFLTSINNNKMDLMTKIASGGELSRFMLALKISLMDNKSTPTLIFDEIDTGIGGNTSNAVGNRLAKLAKESQILVVTHQPQIAAKSDIHFCIKKEKNENKVKTTIEKLEKNCQYKEIARMISGEEITSESLAAAKKLFNK